MVCNMRIIGLTLFVLLFAVTPFYLLNSVVMPQLAQLQQTYDHVDEIAVGAVQQ